MEHLGDSKEIGNGDVDWILLAQDCPVVGCYE
jgi:hypothetical protein